ncbi:O-antigen ligase family protein [Patescibacteria group bacterium]|nr:O-antigen ligase family protein [Patescibacteria group bacterium]
MGKTTNRVTAKTLNAWLIFIFVLLLPTQLGRHFFPPFAFLSGVRSDYLAPTLYLTDLVAGLLVLFNYHVVVRPLALWIKTHPWLAVATLLFAGVNTIGALTPAVAFYQWLKIVEWVGVLLVFVQTPVRPELIITALFIGGLGESLLAIFQLINHHAVGGLMYWIGERPLNLALPGVAKIGLSGKELLRPYGSFSHPNSLAGFYLLIYVWLVGCRENRPGLVGAVLLPLLATVLVFFSFSKVAIATFLLINTFYWFGRLRHSRSSKRSGCRLCVLPKIAVPVLLSLVFFAGQSDPLTLQKRLGLIKNAWVIFTRSPWIGVGMGNYLIAQNQLAYRLLDYSQQPVHNIFFLWLCGVGLVGTAVTCAAVRSAAARIKKNRWPVLIMVLAAVFISGSFDHYWLTLQQNWLLTAVVFGYTVNSISTSTKRS